MDKKFIILPDVTCDLNKEIRKEFEIEMIGMTAEEIYEKAYKISYIKELYEGYTEIDLPKQEELLID